MEAKDITRELIALEQGIQRLRKSNNWLKLGLNEGDFQSQEIIDYLQRPLGENVQLDVETENKIKAAVYLSVKRSKWKPRKIAKQLAEAAAEALRDARLVALYKSNKIGAKQYKEECENNFVSKVVSTTKRIKKRYGRKLVKGVLATALGLVGGPAGLIAGGIMLVSEIIPKKTKEKIRKKVKEVALKAAETISQGVINLYRKGEKIASRIAEKVVKAAENVAEGISIYAAPVVDCIKSVAHTIVEEVKEVGAKVKQGAKKVWKWLTGK